ncbi:MAG: hypothetical protein ACE5I7_00335 [Candidatus Binatia bacterium]
MAYIRIIHEHEATGALKEDYEYLSSSYSKLLGTGTPTPQTYRTSSIVPAYFHFGAVQNQVLTNYGRHDRPMGPVPDIMVNFVVAMYSSCFY